MRTFAWLSTVCCGCSFALPGMASLTRYHGWLSTSMRQASESPAWSGLCFSYQYRAYLLFCPDFLPWKTRSSLWLWFCVGQLLVRVLIGSISLHWGLLVLIWRCSPSLNKFSFFFSWFEVFSPVCSGDFLCCLEYKEVGFDMKLSCVLDSILHWIKLLLCLQFGGSDPADYSMINSF